MTGVIAEVIKLFVWRGKGFDSKRGVLENKVPPVGVELVVAEVYASESGFDGKRCIVLDCS